MAQQKGIIKLKGKIGDISFYKTQDGRDWVADAGAGGPSNIPSGAHSRNKGVSYSRVYAKDRNAVFASLGWWNSMRAMVRVAGRTTRTMSPCFENNRRSSSALHSCDMFLMRMTLFDRGVFLFALSSTQRRWSAWMQAHPPPFPVVASSSWPPPHSLCRSSELQFSDALQERNSEARAGFSKCCCCSLMKRVSSAPLLLTATLRLSKGG